MNGGITIQEHKLIWPKNTQGFEAYPNDASGTAGGTACHRLTLQNMIELGGPFASQQAASQWKELKELGLSKNRGYPMIPPFPSLWWSGLVWETNNWPISGHNFLEHWELLKSQLAGTAAKVCDDVVPSNDRRQRCQCHQWLGIKSTHGQMVCYHIEVNILFFYHVCFKNSSEFASWHPQ